MKKVLIIGGSGAIGQGLIPLFDTNKYEVFWCNSKEFPLPILPVPFAWDDIDVVINLAGLSVLSELHKFDDCNADAILVNCMGAVSILNVFLIPMRERGYGRIIMMSSVCSVINLPEHGVYSACKAFVDKLVKIAAIENAQFGITVNSIQLGYTGIGMGANTTPENIERARNKSSMKRFCTMQELYNTINYIIETEYLTGQNIRLDGGIK
jgi:NAD(P)-dependent dehydrogenase (short-subunit alcohol dehydrogenase family)